MSAFFKVEKAILYIRENFKNQPTLEEISRHVGLSEFHFQKLFSDWAGVSPKKFLQYLTIGNAKQILQESKGLLDVALDSGLSGGGRLHDLFINIEGMTPGEYKDGGAKLTINYDFLILFLGR